MDWGLFFTIIGVGLTLIVTACGLGGIFWTRIKVSENKAEAVEGRIEQKIDVIESRIEQKIDAMGQRFDGWAQMIVASNQDLATRVGTLEGRLKGIQR